MSVQPTEITKEQVLDALRNCYDPEIPVNVVDLGLVYEVNIQDHRVHLKMTLTSPACPVAPMVGEQARKLIEAVPGVSEATVEFVWEPPWNPEMMSWEARDQLGML
ncbi:MAG: iron-sulfur cluster assembly protein [candidate division KSB1 bacterium]|nr:iron-sulfur cluster assembly protein [candidate division KSB1 bacterium]MDZ7303822.1 iron-sulfur cluster assembly protein [candidate division KSB1 bacterium]MDZ7312723.1 iron-sulfur cluster assembly protein [candidate division KSB1 bacterium]